jgi:hypothetical protein
LALLKMALCKASALSGSSSNIVRAVQIKALLQLLESAIRSA